MPKGICNECEEVIGAIRFVLAVTELCCTNLMSRGYRVMNQMDFPRFCRMLYVQHRKAALTTKEKIH